VCRIGQTSTIPTNYVYRLTISYSSGFVPMFENGANDSRFLGVMVRLIPTLRGHSSGHVAVVTRARRSPKAGTS
jgi:hypothetical protein